LDYIFERMSPSFLLSFEKKRRLLSKIDDSISEMRFRNATIQINPPLVMIQERGNVYILRRKLEGIHLEEALDQLRTASSLKEMNREAGIDHMLVATINEIKKRLMKEFHSDLSEEIEDLTFFVPWDLERNIPRIHVDISGISLDTLWIA